MPNKVAPRQVALLVVLLAALVVLVIVRVRPAIRSGGAPQAQGVTVGSYTVPEIGWDREQAREVPTPSARRNLFTFGPPPTPTPDLRPRPTPRPIPTMAPRILPPPTPAGIYVDGKWYPPPPRFSLNYLGWLGPDRLPVAVFRNGEEITVVPQGDEVESRFILREVGPDAVTVGYVGYPQSVQTKVPLSR